MIKIGREVGWSRSRCFGVEIFIHSPHEFVEISLGTISVYVSLVGSLRGWFWRPVGDDWWLQCFNPVPFGSPTLTPITERRVRELGVVYCEIPVSYKIGSGDSHSTTVRYHRALNVTAKPAAGYPSSIQVSNIK